MGMRIVTLNCSHTVIFRGGRDTAPRRGEEILCVRCDDYRLVIQSPNTQSVPEHKVKCHHCIYTRRYPSKEAAIISASSHVRRKRHDVDLLLGDDLLTTFKLNPAAQMTLL